MLLSELEERERRFKLSLRAGIPVVLLISLVFYSIFFRDSTISIDTETAFLFGSLIFVTVYFIYFLMELGVKETLLDQTTQGFNERAFVKKLEQFRPRTLVLFVVNNLSTINENYSTDEVNHLLYTLIHRLNSTLHDAGFSKAVIARRYGAEFIFALEKEAPQIEEVLKTFIGQNQTIDTIEVDYTYAVITNTGDNITKDIQHLKNLLTMQEKQQESSGKAKHLISDSKALSEIEQCITAALEKRSLQLSFRPLLNTHTDTVDIYEVSARLKTPQSGEILPRIYLPVINRLGLGRTYDMALLEHVLTLLPLIDEHVSLSFNLSPFSLRDESFQDAFFEKLEHLGVTPKRIIIELYERKTHHNLSGYLKTLNRFRAKGVRIAIDNFGSSNASMEYMKHFDFDLVQFDRDYVTKLDEKHTRAMLESLIQMAKALHITTVAKWVDKKDQKEELIHLGIDYLQGFGIAKALSETQLIETYNKG